MVCSFEQTEKKEVAPPNSNGSSSIVFASLPALIRNLNDMAQLRLTFFNDFLVKNGLYLKSFFKLISNEAPIYEIFIKIS